ncbi:334_t:CDS:2 [Paraglomus brasilianum]|uniref:334_t:CDS:1 n=1 Tax=Paraglomus brasilianum TaxID=144538 RepID=A0A9N9FFS3_9GLOM|nr:334_t:CDS:2 [Paraglomus brasilianum]
MPPSPKQPLGLRIKELVQHFQFVWWIGHCTVVISTFAYFLNLVLWRSEEAAWWYYWAYRGAILSYGIVVYKSYGLPSWDWDYIRSINRDENIFYLALALVWHSYPPIIATLIPNATFSLFHFLTYLRTNVIPTFAPQAASSPRAGTKPALSGLSKSIQTWVNTYYEGAMRIVSFTEVVVITASLIWNIITLQVPLYTLLIYGFFLRIRYHMNQYTKRTFSHLGQRLDSWLLPPSADSRIPPYVTNAYRHAKTAVAWFGQVHPVRR